MKYENVKIGDEFLVSSRYKQGIYKVTKVTSKRFECGSLMWNKTNGYMIGGDAWNSAVLKDITEEDKQIFLNEQKRHKLIIKLGEVSFRNMALSKLEAIDKFISGLE
jgi:hypothetical protein